MSVRTAVLSDLHANREALEAVLEHAERQAVDSYALLGDFVGYGADPAWVVDRVRELVAGGAVAVQGNHDLATAEGASPGMRPEPRQVIEWTRGQLDAEQIAFLAELPPLVRTDACVYVHANAWDPLGYEYVLGRSEAARSLQAAGTQLSFCGHVHEARLYHADAQGRVADFLPTPGAPVPLLPLRQWLVIAGSVGQPRDGDPAACYVVYDSRAQTVTWWRVPYDHEGAAAKIRAAGLPPALADRLAEGL